MAPKRQLGAMAAAVAAESDSELAARLQRELNSLRGTRVRPACISDGVPGAPLAPASASPKRMATPRLTSRPRPLPPCLKATFRSE